MNPLAIGKKTVRKEDLKKVHISKPS